MVILGPDKAHSLLQTCSRDAPGRDAPQLVETWLPSREQVSKLEAHLPSAVFQFARTKVSAADLNFFRKNIYRYMRQYGGIVIGKRKLIYLNAFPFSDWEMNDPLMPLSDKWYNIAYRVCDGGPVFFGAQYDPVTEQFVGFQFNGAL